MRLIALLPICTGLLLLPCELRAQVEPSFNRNIRPILAAKCFACHGPDENRREADLRLDLRAEAVQHGALLPGDADESELVRRIYAADPDEQMPPPESNESLTDGQKERLRAWVASGATYDKHWAFVPPSKPSIAADVALNWPRNPIDYLVLDRLEADKMEPLPEADRYTVVRRVYLDLIGLPPTPAEADQFVHSTHPAAYDRLVDRLLSSTQYGERWARQWLDLARYADTNGYEKDRPRSIWHFRDWVIRALNDDMPFNQFTIEQLAGDMLPGATTSQRIATGFHRNTMLNEEGGIDPLEYRFYAMVDRVATTGTVWMGLTTGCAQCHSHKYDPISHTEYYRLLALLNNADEPDLVVEDASVAARRKEIETEIAKLEVDLPDYFPPAEGAGSVEQRGRQSYERAFNEWLKDEQSRAVAWTVVRPIDLKTNLPKLEVLEDGSILSSGDITKRDVFMLTFRLDERLTPVTSLRLEALPDPRLPAGGPGRGYYEGRKGDFFLSEITGELDGQPVKFSAASHSYGKISVGSGSAQASNVIDGKGSTGWSTSGREGEPHQLVLNLAEPLLAAGQLRVKLLFERHFAASLGRFRFSMTTSSARAQASQVPVEIEALLARNIDRWTDREEQDAKRYFLRVAPQLADARRRIDQLRQKMPEYPATMVMLERPADNSRKTFRHHRGEYLSVREEVDPGVPAIFAQLPDRQPPDRLTFARWLVSDRNPLVGRVTVNRAWQAFFGGGLVPTSGDFGTQSDPPRNPKLLDWLACEFVDRGWSMKELHRLIVTSATYRQSSHGAADLFRRDPQNQLLARGPRHRVDAEVVRDMMLKASGLLSAKMYGPSVYPPQPASVTALAYGSTKWNPSAGEDRYRRSIYTFSKRTAPFAAFTVFDSPSGESCIARRDRSNTPLQALTMLNDEMFLELSRALARQAVNQHPDAVRYCATYIFRTLHIRPPDASELAALVDFQRAQRERLESGELNAVDISNSPRAEPGLAAWAMVARVLMNVDEAITKP